MKETNKMVLADLFAEAQPISTWSDALVPVWLGVLSVAAAIVGVWKVRESNHVRELILKLDIADRERSRLTDRVSALEACRVEMVQQAAQREALIEVLNRRIVLQRAEIKTMTRLLAKYDQAAHEAVIETDEGGIIQRWDAAATIMFGWSADEAVGQDVSVLIVPPDIRQAHRDGMQSVHYMLSQPRRFDKGYQVRSRPISTQALHRDGENFPVEVQLFPPWKVAGKVDSWRYAARIRRLTLPDPTALPAIHSGDSSHEYKPTVEEMREIEAAGSKRSLDERAKATDDAIPSLPSTE